MFIILWLSSFLKEGIICFKKEKDGGIDLTDTVHFMTQSILDSPPVGNLGQTLNHPLDLWMLIRIAK